MSKNDAGEESETDDEGWKAKWRKNGTFDDDQLKEVLDVLPDWWAKNKEVDPEGTRDFRKEPSNELSDLRTTSIDQLLEEDSFKKHIPAEDGPERNAALEKWKLVRTPIAIWEWSRRLPNP